MRTYEVHYTIYHGDFEYPQIMLHSTATEERAALESELRTAALREWTGFDDDNAVPDEDSDEWEQMKESLTQSEEERCWLFDRERMLGGIWFKEYHIPRIGVYNGKVEYTQNIPLQFDVFIHTGTNIFRVSRYGLEVEINSPT